MHASPYQHLLTCNFDFKAVTFPSNNFFSFCFNPNNHTELITDKRHIKPTNINDNKLIGIAFTVIYEYDNNPNITFKTKSNELGSSGGLMMSLYVYNSLIEEDITKGYDIAGTGTIELDGTVGEIDGVKYKILGAYKKGIRVFIVPEQNYEEAKKVVEENKLNLKVINVSTFDEAINKLKELK